MAPEVGPHLAGLRCGPRRRTRSPTPQVRPAQVQPGHRATVRSLARRTGSPARAGRPVDQQEPEAGLRRGVDPVPAQAERRASRPRTPRSPASPATASRAAVGGQRRGPEQGVHVRDAAVLGRGPPSPRPRARSTAVRPRPVAGPSGVTTTSAGTERRQVRADLGGAAQPVGRRRSATATGSGVGRGARPVRPRRAAPQQHEPVTVAWPGTPGPAAVTDVVPSATGGRRA